MMKLKMVPVSCALALTSGLADQAIFSPLHHDSFFPAAFAQDLSDSAKEAVNEITKPDPAQDPAKDPAKDTGATKLPPCLAEISRATVVEDGALRSSKLRDSLLAAQKLGVGAREMLTEMAQTATPAGRLLALALLKKIDPAQYQKLAGALKQELGDQSVSYISPSERCHYSVSDILNDMASTKPLINMLPLASHK